MFVCLGGSVLLGVVYEDGGIERGMGECNLDLGGGLYR
jgi:hypothetical protein